MESVSTIQFPFPKLAFELCGWIDVTQQLLDLVDNHLAILHDNIQRSVLLLLLITNGAITTVISITTIPMVYLLEESSSLGMHGSYNGPHDLLFTLVGIAVRVSLSMLHDELTQPLVTLVVCLQRPTSHDDVVGLGTRHDVCCWCLWAGAVSIVGFGFAVDSQLGRCRFPVVLWIGHGYTSIDVQLSKDRFTVK